jgi:polynucleotide kinase-phosphatase
MSPSETTSEPGLLEHPAEAFGYFRRQGVRHVVCEEKHMGSRAVVVVCRDEGAARKRFGVSEGELGIVYTRTGRRFFDDAQIEHALLARLATAMTAARIWERLETTWACLDCELMPWSAKAQELLRQQYAAVGSAGRAALPRVMSSLEQLAARTNGEHADAATSLLERFRPREAAVGKFVAAYRQYCWPVNSIEDLKLAPFHLPASEGKVHVDQTHTWHMQVLHEIADQDSAVLRATPHRTIDVTDDASQAEGIAWWEQLTAAGGEGMVVKPIDFVVRGSQGIVQPALKCRGPEYLRIIYGPDYTAEENLTRLRRRGLGLKRSLAVREFALGIEALERFVRREPLRRVHECVFGVIALESEPVDPRL